MSKGLIKKVGVSYTTLFPKIVVLDLIKKIINFRQRFFEEALYMVLLKTISVS